MAYSRAVTDLGRRTVRLEAAPLSRLNLQSWFSRMQNVLRFFVICFQHRSRVGKLEQA